MAISTSGGLAAVPSNIRTAVDANGNPIGLLGPNGQSYPVGQLGTGNPGKNVIFDSQWNGDIDNHVGLRVLDWAVKRQLINLLAVTNSMNSTGITDNPAPQLVNLIQNFDGVSPAAYNSGPTTTILTITATVIGSILTTSFTPSRRLLTAQGLNTAVPVLRAALANANGLVTFLCGGPGNNLYDLLNSAADAISPLTGAQLVASKVSTLVWVGGQYPLSTAPVGGEYNFGNIPTYTTTLWPITAFILANWPTPITFVGFEVGGQNSVGGFYSLTPTDPLGFLFNESANYQFGRQGWGSVAALIALQGPAKAGFTTVAGTNTINTSTGFNTFNPGLGNHQYVVQAVSMRALQQNIDAICAPGVTQPAGYLNVAETVPTTPALANVTTDGADLIVWHIANDVALTNGASVPAWQDRCGRANQVQATGALQPTYNTALGGKIAVSFSGTQCLNSDVTVDLPHEVTIYCLGYNTDSSTNFKFMCSHGASSGSTNLRNIDLQRARSSDTNPLTCKSDSVIQNTFSTAAATLTLTTSTWHVYAVTRSGGTLTCYVDGVNAGSVTIAGPAGFDALQTNISNHIIGLLTMGAQYVNSSPAAVNPWTGGIRELRVYNNAHSPAMVATISALMT